jgi:hypothetical protein
MYICSLMPPQHRLVLFQANRRPAAMVYTLLGFVVMLAVMYVIVYAISWLLGDL